MVPSSIAVLDVAKEFSRYQNKTMRGKKTIVFSIVFQDVAIEFSRCQYKTMRGKKQLFPLLSFRMWPGTSAGDNIILG